MMAIFRRNLWGLRRSFLIWSAILGLMTVLRIPVFNSIKNNPGFNEFLKTMPDYLKAMMGDQLEAVTTINGFLASQHFQISWLLVGGLFAAVTGSGLLAREVDRGTLGLLLSRPVSRTQVVVAKFFVLPVVYLLFAGVGLFFLWGSLLTVEETPRWEGIWMSFLYGWMMLIAIGSVSLLLSSAASDSQKASMSAIGLFLGSYLLNGIGSLQEGVEFLRWFSFAHYYNSAELFAGQGEPADSVFFLLISAISLLSAVMVFNRRNFTL
ncbi:ABC transporter permease subunit [Salinithrix halophila]|uniref:ABC transporter permease subunit n=1 Tax=Salinithrix halophila TaxID=1485204 RepID=A0ABV8JQ95_9BACL